MIYPDSLWNLESLSDRELSRRCHRLLFANARAHWHGPRAELRRRVRSFLRGRRHDRASMCSILRGVAASSLFAVALLGLNAQAAHAVEPQFIFSPNSVVEFDVGFYSAPAFADLDGDGDQDLISGESLGTFRYFENIGSASSPAFVDRTGLDNPLDGLDVGYYSAPTFADLDADGDLDLLAGEDLGTFLYFENTGSASSPTFVARTGLDNPLDGFSVGYDSSPVLADLDADGDLDLLAGEDSGALLYFENTGSASSAVFVARSGPSSPVDGLISGGYSAPALADLDRDGDLDLVVGEYPGTFAYFENTGSLPSPTFVARTGTANPLDIFDLGFNATPAFADLDMDGDHDLVSGNYDGTFRLIKNTTPIINLNFVEQAGSANPLGGFSTYGYTAPVLADLDNDGDLDVISGEYYGIFHYFENTGLATEPIFVELAGAANPFDGFSRGYDSTPALADLDDDGDLDLVAGSYYGTFAYFENTGLDTSPIFVERSGIDNPLDGFGVGNFSTPALVDLDGDGDFDLVSGEGVYDGAFLYFENIGSPINPDFVERTGVANPLDGFMVGGFSTPTFVDLDGDFDLDLVSGEGDGTFFYFENTGSTSNPAFAKRNGTENPLIGLNPGLSSTPTFADLDDDGRLDLASGESTGTFVYYLPEPHGWMTLFAGTGMLTLFSRRKTRNPPA